MNSRYKIAEQIVEIIPQANDAWALVKPNYAPFATTDSADAAVSIRIVEGLDLPMGDIPAIYEDVAQTPDMPSLYVHRDDRGHTYFRIVQPKDSCERVVLVLDHDGRNATIHIEKKGSAPRPWQAIASLTAAIQLTYTMATMHTGNLLSHASCVAKDGKAYLFLGKSGTGKSTHSRMWQEAFADAQLLNDDHPIIRVAPSGEVIAYGSPWSGKTPCYRNISAPIGGIVRITRSLSNSIRRLSPIEAYASLMPSMFSAPFDRQLADRRHQWIERVVATVPCYELQCLPNADAARVCWAGIENKQKG